MTTEIIILLVILAATIFLFATEMLPIDLVALMAMAGLLLSGIITPEEGIAGFSNLATITVGAMFVLSAGLSKTGAGNFIISVLKKLGRGNFWLTLISIMVMIGAISAFINNTAAVVIFLPIILEISRDIQVSPSKLLMPLSFASMFGGVCTLIGTSTNILVSSIAQKHGHRAFTMFEFAPLGLVLMAVGCLYMILIGVRLIPNRRAAVGPELTATFGMGDYIFEVALLPESEYVGKAMKELPMREDPDIDVLEVYRNGLPLWPLSMDYLFRFLQKSGLGGSFFKKIENKFEAKYFLKANDVLCVRSNQKKIGEFKEKIGGRLLKPAEKLREEGQLLPEDILIEVVIAPNSPIVGKSLKETRFLETFGATVLAVRYGKKITMHKRLATRPVKAGDVLLIEINHVLLDQLKQSGVIVVTEVGEFKKHKMLYVLAIIFGVVASAVLNLMPIVVGAIAGCVLLVLTGCITLEEARSAIDWEVIFLLAGVLALGTALDKTGAAKLFSSFLLKEAGGWGPVGLVSAFYLLTSLLSELMSNNASAALLAPIAIATAESLGMSMTPFLMAVTFAASNSYMTPVGYQTNTIIYGVGQYRYADFLRVGTPLNIVYWLLATLLIPWFWPF
jgi:di/tricarboxylate transporter